LVFLFCSISYPVQLGAQNSKLDSLNSIYENNVLSDSARFLALRRLTFKLIFFNGDSAKRKITDGLNKIEKAEGKTRNYYNLYQNLGVYYAVYQEIDSAQAIFSKILSVSEKSSWKHLKQRSLNNLGMNSLNSSKYRMAIEYFSNALELAKEDGDSKPSQYVNYISNLGLANQELELYEQAIAYHNEALAIRQQLGDKNGMSISQGNLGICYRQLEDFSTAIIHFEAAVKNAKAAGNMTQYHRLHDNMGSLYLGIENYPKAFEMFEIALDTSNEHTLDPKIKLSIYSNMASALADLNDLDKAEKYAHLAQAELEKYPDLKNYSLALFDVLATIHFKEGDYEKGSHYLERFRTISKEVYNAENAQLLTDLQVKYELQKKENQIALQESKLQEQNAILQRNYFALAAIALLILMLSGAFIYSRRQHKREQELLVRDRELKVGKAQLEATTQTQEHERKRIAQDLHDGFGQFISALRIYISQLKLDERSQSEVVELISRCENILDEMSKEISATVNNLMPTTLLKKGLRQALVELAARLHITGKTQIKVENFEDRLNELIETNLYRICQEWINNVLKYADAKEILVRFERRSGHLTLSISDNGRGFDTSVLDKSMRNGWKNINARAKLLGGSVEIKSSEKEYGSLLFVDIPLMEIYT